MPSLACLRLYDNRTQFEKGKAIEEPRSLLEMRAAKRPHPAMLVNAADTPDRATPTLEVVFHPPCLVLGFDSSAS